MWTLTPTPTLMPTPGVVHKLFWTSSRRAKKVLSEYVHFKHFHWFLSFQSGWILSKLYQGGESHDLSRLFCTCIRTQGVRKLFIISLILNVFSSSEVHIPCLCKQQMNIEVVFFYPHNLEQRHSVFARVCEKKYSMHGNIFKIMLIGSYKKAMRYLRFTVWKCIEY